MSNIVPPQPPDDAEGREEVERSAPGMKWERAQEKKEEMRVEVQGVLREATEGLETKEKQRILGEIQGSENYNVQKHLRGPLRYLRNDKDVALALIRKHTDNLAFVSHELRDDPEVILAAFEYGGYCSHPLLHASERLRGDRDFILQLVRKRKDCLKYISKVLRTDAEVVLTAMNSEPSVSELKYVSKELFESRDFVLSLVKIQPQALRYVPTRFTEDKEVVHAALSFKGWQKLEMGGLALEYAAPVLQDDEEIVHAAVRSHGRALGYASERLKNDKSIVLDAVRDDPDSLLLASSILQQDRELLEVAVGTDGRVLEKLPKYVRADKTLVLVAVRNWPQALAHTDKRLQSDRDVVYEAVSRDGRVLEHASLHLRNDREVVLRAVRQNGLALEHASIILQIDRGVVLEAVRQDGRALLIADRKFMDDREIVLEAVAHDGGEEMDHYMFSTASTAHCYRKIQEGTIIGHWVMPVLGELKEEFRADKQIVEAATKRNGTALCFASPDFCNQKDFVLLALRQIRSFLETYHRDEQWTNAEFLFTSVLNNVPASLRNDPDIKAVTAYDDAG